jgi:hypothetical protein
VKTDAEIRARLVKMLRTFATEVRMEFEGRTADAVARGIDEIALSVEKRTKLTMLTMVEPEPESPSVTPGSGGGLVGGG